MLPGASMMRAMRSSKRSAITAAAAIVAVYGAPGLGAAVRATPAASRILVGPVFQQVVPGRVPSFAWPLVGQAAVGVAGVGLLASSPDQRRVPIASLTKMMTALVVLGDHPLVPGQAGPRFTISQQDVQEWKRELRAGDSVVEVRAGEVLTEYQALEALLVPSADNIADRLASWDAGTLGAFVGKMNALRRTFKLGATHYADPSGLNPRSVSTASDQAYVAARLMTYPVVRAIVRSLRINLPVVGVLPNLNPALSVDGIIGVKGGFTSHAKHCLVTAAYRMRHAALVVSVTLGQPDPRAPAHIDEALLEAATTSLERRRLILAEPTADTHTVAARGVGVRLVAPGASATVVVWPGLVLHDTISNRPAPTARTNQTNDRRTGARTVSVSSSWGELASFVAARSDVTSGSAPGSHDNSMAK